MSSEVSTIGPPTDRQTAAIRELEHRRYEAMLDVDIPTLSALLSEWFVYTHSSGLQDDKRDFLAKLGARRFVFHTIDHEVVAVTRVGSVFVVQGRMKSLVEVDDIRREIDNLSLAVWSGCEPGAQIIAYASTRAAGAS